jgi:hypothetical protein
MPDRDPVAWTLIEPGWSVVDAAGEDVGHVDEVTGDSSIDIFNGLAISSGPLGKPHYVPSENVARIYEHRVELSLTKDEIKRLGGYVEPPVSAELSSESASLIDRTEEAIRGSSIQAEPMSPLRRGALWLRSLFRHQ